MMTPKRQALALVSTFAITSSPLLGADATAVQDQTLTVDEQTFRYLSAGSKGTPVLLLHGWPCDRPVGQVSATKSYGFN